MSAAAPARGKDSKEAKGSLSFVNGLLFLISLILSYFVIILTKLWRGATLVRWSEVIDLLDLAQPWPDLEFPYIAHNWPS